jgi:nicotinamide riboside kinase
VNSQPDVKTVLALLDTLRGEVRHCVAREEKLNRELRVQSAASENALARLNEKQETNAGIALATAETAFEAEKFRLRQWSEHRQTRIRRVQDALDQRVLARLNDQDKDWETRTQQGVKDAEQRCLAGLADAAAAFEQSQQQWTGAGDTLDRLETSARHAFAGYGWFRRSLAPPNVPPVSDSVPDEKTLFAEQLQLQKKITEELARFKKLPLPLVFKWLPLWLLATVLVGFAALGLAGPRFGWHAVSPLAAGVALAALFAVGIIYFLGGRMAAPRARTLAGDLVRARRDFAAGVEKSNGHYQQEQTRLNQQFDETRETLNGEWRQAVRETGDLRRTRPSAIHEKAVRLTRRDEQWQQAALAQLQERRLAAVAQLKMEDAAQVRQITAMHAATAAQLAADQQRGWAELEADWKSRIQSLGESIRAASAAAEKNSPAWDAASWSSWTPPATFQNAATFGRLEVDVAQFAGPLPQDARLRWPDAATISLPLSLVSPQQSSILFETTQAGGNEAVAAMNNLIFRLLAATPPGKLSFTIFDPVGLGQNFAALMHLADYEEGSINSRIWTQTAQFEERLAELNEHMEKIIQMYLRNEYATIAEYNAEAGSVAEKYHFLVIASFPVNFSETAARRLRNIAASGARCGVYTLIHWDQRNALPQDFVADELRKNSVNLVRADNGFELANWRPPGVRLLLDPPPPAELATDFLQRVGEGSKNSSRVEVPFEVVAPAASEMWTEETAGLLRVPIGRAGATKLQYLEIGRGTRQHVLIAGKTGSGKSTLFHVIITNLAARCSPEEVEFYLVDFKKGVEFKCYANRKLPHARVIAIESDREFGLSVLQRVDDELRRRGDLFRKMGAQDLPGYKRAGGQEAVPRTLLMIDEFQEFFTEEDRISQGAAVLLDRIVRQGRAFGIHVILGSQTLGGAYTLARATLGQMVIRIALQCNEADAYLIMDQDNPAPRLLSRPGEGIYNDEAGALTGNSPFQAVWLSDKTRDGWLAKIRERADHSTQAYPGPLVFEGNAPADVRENLPLNAALKKPAEQIPVSAGVWLGAPNSIKGPTEAIFRRQSGGNLLVVGQSEERTTTILAVALVSLAAQFPPADARFVLLDSTPEGFPQRKFLERIVHAIPHETTLAGNGELTEVMGRLAEELKQRAEKESSGPAIFVLVHGLQNFKKLRQEDEFSFSGSGTGNSPAATLLSLITEGSARGIHLIVTADTYNNVTRFLGRKALTEFEMRVVFQMSASDSASLIDAPDAATLGLHRALYYNEREGSLETFRPYAPPGDDWIAGLARP